MKTPNNKKLQYMCCSRPLVELKSLYSPVHGRQHFVCRACGNHFFKDRLGKIQPVQLTENTPEMQRPEVSLENVAAIIAEVHREWFAELQRKGLEIFASTHEIDGVLREEANGVTAEIGQNGDKNLRHPKIRKELIDVIVAALHGVASIDSGKMSW